MNPRIAMLAAYALLAPPSVGQDESAGLEQLRAALDDACVRGDRARIEDLRGPLGELVAEAPEDALAHYLLGLAGVQLVLHPNGAPDVTDQERAREVLEEATRHLARAIELDPLLDVAYAAAVLSNSARFALGVEDLQALSQETLELGRRAAEVAPESRPVRFVGALLAMSSPAAAGGRGLPELLEELHRLAEDVAIAAEAAGAAPWWDLFILGMVARSCVFMPQPDLERAAEYTALCLRLRPDFRMARGFLSGFVAERETLAPEVWAGVDFTEVATDPGGDSGAPGLPDARSLALWCDPEAGRLWARIDLEQPLDATAFGVNLVVDRGAAGRADQLPWWGGNRELRFDRLVTVWVARDAAGTYRGAVGVAGAAAAVGGEMTSLLDGGVGFALAEEGHAVLLRVPLAALDLEKGARVIAAVGTNARWSDDVPSEGTVALGPLLGGAR